MRSPVSVIIPCYRCADTIERAVDSVVLQTLPPEELLLVEDCSDDAGRTLEALHRLKQIYQETISIKIIALDSNLGPGGARNAGWNEARQPYLAFLDADDSWHGKKLELQYQWMVAQPDVILTGHQTKQIEKNQQVHLLSELIVSHIITKGALLMSNRFPARSVMLRQEIEYRFDPLKRYAEDYLLWLQIVMHGGKAVLLALPLSYSYKADYGGSGLSGNAWQMEKGELDTYRRIYREGLISPLVYLGCISLSLVKHLRRVVYLLFSGSRQ